MRFFDENIFFFSIFFSSNSTLLKGIFQTVQTLLPSSVYITSLSNGGLFIAMIGAIACHRGDAARQDTSLSAA